MRLVGRLKLAMSDGVPDQKVARRNSFRLGKGTETSFRLFHQLLADWSGAESYTPVKWDTRQE